MLPVTSRRIDYTDEVYEDSAPPTRTTGVLSVTYWHNEPYRTHVYGRDAYEVDGVVLTGEAIADEDWETFRQNLHARAHKARPPYARVTHAEMRVPERDHVRVVWASLEAPAASLARVVWAEVKVPE